MERLQKVMSMAGVASRRESEKLIVDGKVKVNGQVITALGTKVDITKDRVEVDGKRIGKEELVYFLMYKPRGTITSVKDEKGRKTVVDLMAAEKCRVYPVGRLDYNTEGVLLLTNDGTLTNQLIHPRYKIRKIYEAIVEGIPDEDKLDKLRIGVALEDGVTEPAIVQLLGIDPKMNLAKVEIIIHEGRNRQVRRMFEVIGYPVKTLKRTQFATLTLRGLKRGGYRELTENELESLKKLQ